MIVKKLFKKLCKKLLRMFGFGVFKLDAFELVNFDNLLYLLLNTDGKLKYIQVGANDGIMADPLYQFISRNKEATYGIAIEPVPKYYRSLVKNLDGFENVIPLQIAIHNEKKSVEIFYPNRGKDFEEDRSSSVNGISSLDKSHLLKSGMVEESQVSSISVESHRLVDVIDQFEFQDFNLLVVDIEGYDYELLSKFDLERFKPKIVRFEHSLRENIENELNLANLIHHFGNFGYQIWIDNNDATAVHFSLFSKTLANTIA